MGGIWWQEIKNALYGMDPSPEVTDCIAGICGADVSPEMIEEMLIGALRREGSESLPRWVGREIP